MRQMAMVIAVLLAGTISVFGQETTGTMTGQVVDAQGLAIPGVTVTITGTQGAKTVVSDGEGRFDVPFLTPGKYAVKAELQGFQTVEQRDITLSLGQTVSLPLKMQVGGLTESVQVVGAPDIIDTKTTTSGANISSDLLQRVPVGRNIGSTLYLAPGVSSSGTAGAANPSIAGGSGLDNQYVIDGVNVTNQGYGALGSYSIVFGSLGNATPFDFMQEVQVKTGGYQAEFGQATGGLVNVITKSGSNKVAGSLFGYTRPSGLESDFTQYQSINGSVQTVGARAYDAGIEGGFPIIRNKLFAFAAIDPGRDVTTFQAPQGFPLLTLGHVDRVRDEPYVLGESDMAACQRAPNRCVLLRGSVEGSQRPAANVGAARQQHRFVQFVDIRRAQSNDPIQRRTLQQLAARRRLRARVERYQRNALRGHMARHRPDRQPEPYHGRHRILRSRQSQRQQPVLDQIDSHPWRPPGQIRLRVPMT